MTYLCTKGRIPCRWAAPCAWRRHGPIGPFGRGPCKGRNGITGLMASLLGRWTWPSLGLLLLWTSDLQKGLGSWAAIGPKNGPKALVKWALGPTTKKKKGNKNEIKTQAKYDILNKYEITKYENNK